MPKHLTTDQVAFYKREDYLSPIPIISADEAAALLAELDAFKARTGESVVTALADKPYLLLKSLSDLSRHPGVLDTIEDLIGPDILLAEVGFFWKEPGDPYYAAWHQDATYLRMEPLLGVSTWIGLTDSRVDNGCLRVIPRTQGSELPLHMIDDPDNYLRMNREISIPLDEASAVDLELAAGQMSVHGRIVHGSRPNRSARRRVGYSAMYIPPQVRMGASALTSASLVRGEDRFGHYELEPEPAYDYDPAAVAIYEKQVSQGLTGDYRWD
jgi:ectoine hydroxylase-related dioxygenase (phytanoyl-CoA dioxygenase family)